MRQGMGTPGQKRLIIIGAGPKAMALAAKQTALAEIGKEVPELHIIEKSEVGAHWTGRGGFTNGELRLGTSPEKDVGFPYHSDRWGHELGPRVDRRMRDFSWTSYLIDKGDYSDWIDRGRPAPCHAKWAEYLQWLSRQVMKRSRLHVGEAVKIELGENYWRVTVRAPGGNFSTVEGDGLVMTGPGKVRMTQMIPNHDEVHTIETFWRRFPQFQNGPARDLAIVGSGESAAAIAMALESTRARHRITLFCPKGMAYSRGESFFENRIYSNADRESWQALSLEARREFISRTDRGVFSQAAQAALSRTEAFRIIPGRFQRVETHDGKLELISEYQGVESRYQFETVILAPGADPLAFLAEVMTPATLNEIERRAAITTFDEDQVETKMDAGLALKGLTPRLHLPMLAGLTQGPGFANLSCLGRLSDHILSDYVH